MATKRTTTKKSSPKRSPQTAPKQPPKLGLMQRLEGRTRRFLARRPHRSFRLSRRRDYARSLVLPSYTGFTGEVMKTLWGLRRQLFYLIVAYTVLTTLFATIVSQDAYRQVYDSVNASLEGVATGAFGEVIKTGSLLVGAVGGSLSSTTSDVQQIYAACIGVFTWLTTIWLLRARLAGARVGFRDALYSSGAPIVATLIVGLLFLLQLVPGATGIIGYQTLVESGLTTAGVLAMLVTIVALLLIILSLYLLTSSIFAFVIVTLPGMYPMRAIRTAGDLVTGRRLRILLRLFWMLLLVVIVWAVVMIPFVIGINALQDKVGWLEHVAIIPVAIIIMTALSTVWGSAYIYLLYRRMVDDDAAPA